MAIKIKDFEIWDCKYFSSGIFINSEEVNGTLNLLPCLFILLRIESITGIKEYP